jgi:hypothetical protein
MRPLTLLYALASASAADAPTASTSIHGGLATSFTTVAGPNASDGSSFNPSFTGTLRPRFTLSHGAFSSTAQWGISRTQTLCDTCDDPTTVEGRDARVQPLRALNSDDLLLMNSIGSSGPVRATVRADAVLPASRDAFVCNPFYGAVGAGTSLSVAAGGSEVLVSGSVRRSFFQHDAVPVGLDGCSRDFDSTVQTLAGPVDPTPWQGDRFTTANPRGAASASLMWSNPHRLFTESTTFFTNVSIGLNATRTQVHVATEVDTLSGAVPVPASVKPWTTRVPASVTAGWNVSTPVSLALTVSNALPGVMADPGASVRMLPAATAATLTADAHF